MEDTAKSGRRRESWFVRLRNDILYRPLVAAVALVLALPPASWLTTGARVSPAAAHAQTITVKAPQPPDPSQAIQLCSSNQNAIFAHFCSYGTASSIAQFEDYCIKLYLANHNMPYSDSDVAFVHQNARGDLRMELRAFMFLQLMYLATLQLNSLPQYQIDTLNYFQSLVWQNEKTLYMRALDNFKSWQSNKCGWQPDSDLAHAMNFNYVPCVASEAYNTAPTEDYFLVAAAKQVYQTSIANLYNGPAYQEQFQKAVVTELGAGGAAGLASGLTAGLVWANAPRFAISFTPYALEAVNAVYKEASIAASNLQNLIDAGAEQAAIDAAQQAADDAVIAASEAAADSVGSAFAATGIGIIIGIAIALIVTATVIVVEETIAENQILNDLTAKLNGINTTQPDLAAMAKDSTGYYKENVTWLLATLPDNAPTNALPTHGGTDPVLIISPAMGTPTTGPLSYTDPQGTSWTVDLYQNWWVGTGTQGSRQVQTISPTILIQNWSGVSYTASRMGSNWILTKTQPADSDVLCPADAVSGLSNPPDPTVCSSLVTHSVQMMAGPKGAQYKATLQIGVAPAFTSSANLSFYNHSFGIGDGVAASGFPAPLLKFTSAAPSGFTFWDSTSAPPPLPGYAAVNYSSAAAGTYQATVTATNLAGSATQNLTITVLPANTLVFTNNTRPDLGYYGQPFNYLITTSGGVPPIHFTENFSLPNLTFTDNGDGTLTLSGLVPTDPGTQYCPSPYCKITATDSNGTSANAAFMYFMNTPPTPAVVAPPNNTWLWGIPNSMNIVATGAATPVTFGFAPSSCGLYAPSWLNLTSSSSGVATLSGNPPVDDFDQNLNFRVVANTPGIPQDTSCTPNVHITMLAKPAFTSVPNPMKFYFNTGSSYTIATNTPAGPTLLSSLPSGITFKNNGDGTGTISGNYFTTGIAGDYNLVFQASTADGAIQQNVTLSMIEAPRLLLPGTIYFMEGVKLSNHIQTSGNPASNNMTLQGGLPKGVYFVPPTSSRPGIGLLTGTPAAGTAGSYSLTLQAYSNFSSSYPTAASLVVLKAGDVNHDGKTDCSDVNVVKAALNSKNGQANYSLAADVNQDGVVNIADLAFVTSKLPSGTACH